MPKTAKKQKKNKSQKSQEIIFKEASLFRKIVSFITAYSMMFLNVTPVFATNITGVSGNNGVYNIEASKISGSTGFRQYNDFTLDKGDVANLQFKKGSKEYGKFVNLVDNKVDINGIVNTVKGDAFYNGHAIFVSPKGIVVGASGVLNVGALTMVAPNQDKYDDFKDAFEDGDLGDYIHGGDKYKEVLSAANGDITINGKIISGGDVEIYGKNITIEGKSGDRAGIVAGAKTQNKITTQAQAKQVFDTLVSNNINSADLFSLEGGKIKIKAGATETSNSVKDAKIEVKKADLGASQVDIKAEVESADKIDMVKTEINVEDSKITANSIDIKAESKRNHTLILGDNDYIQGLNSTIIEFLSNLIAGEDSHYPFGATGASDAKVTIKDSVLRAIEGNVAINAVSTFSIEDNVNLMKPALLMMLIDLFRDNDYDPEVMPTDASFTQFFDSNLYEAYDGPRTRAEVTVDNSSLTADKGNITIETDASSKLELSTGTDGLIIPIGLYGFGTGTVSRAIVKNQSKLTAAAGNVNVDAFSDNTNKISVSNTGITSFAIEDFFILAIVNNAVKTTTEARVEDSTVKTKDLNVRAINLTDSDVDLEIETLAGMSSQQPQDDPQQQTQGNSAVSGVGVLHRSDNNVTAIIKNSTITDTNTSVLAQSLNITSNSGDAGVDDPMQEKPKPYSWMQWERNIQNGLHNFQRQYINKSLFNRIKGGAKFKGQQGATAEIGGVFVWSNTQNKATAKIENSTVNATGDVSVQANTIDVLANNATADTTGVEKFSLSGTVIINDEKNTTNADVSGSTIKAKNLTVNATTEMPMNEFELIFGLKFPFKIKGIDGAYYGKTFGHEANGKWDVNSKYPTTSEDAAAFDFSYFTNKSLYENYENLKPKFRWSGLFNNFAQTAGIGSVMAVSFSVIYNEIVNNTTASLTNSDVTLKAVETNGKYDGGDLVVNAVNSVIGYNGLGMVDYFIKKINYYIPGQVNWEYEPQIEAGKFGLGVNFLWDIYENNATAKVDNSKVNTENGDATVSAANEQEHVNLQVTGGKSELIGIEGSVNVQKIKGSTLAQVLNGSEITAENIEVNAGKATIETAGGEPEIDKNTHEADLNDEREAEDAMTVITFMPSWTSQSAEQENVGQSTSTGVAVGASVDVINIDRTIKAEVNGSTLESEDNTDVKADTYSQILNIVGAAAWSGGVTPPEPDENVAGHDIGNANENAQNAQDEEENIFGNLFDGEEDFMQQPVGNALEAVQNKFSLSLAGAVLVLNDNTNVAANVSASDLTVGNNLNVLSDREARMITISGGLSKSGQIGVGAAVDIYKSDGSVKANILDSTVKFNKENATSTPEEGETVDPEHDPNANPRLKVNAHNINKAITIAIGAGLAPGANVNDQSIKAAIGGSYNKNTLKPEIEAGIKNSTVETEDDTKKPDITVNAENDVTLYNIAGGGVYINGGTQGLGAGAAINYNNIKHTISSYITNSVLKNINKVSVTADADNDLNDFAVAGSLALGAQTSGWTFDGSADIDYIHDTISSQILGSSIEAGDDIIVKADSKSANLGAAGTFDINLTNGGLGVNGDLVVNVFRNNITAEIGNSYKTVKKEDGTTETVTDRQSKILKAKDVKISATSTEKSNVIPIGVAVGTGGQFVMAAANVGVNLIDNTVKAYLSGNVGTGDDAEAVHDVAVAAYDETTLYSRGGTVGVATNENAIVVFAGSVNVDKINKTVEAKIQNADIKASGNVNATASSINSMGGTKNDDNEYTRDDVTTEAYREKMLHKNSNDEYDGLKLKKKDDSDEYVGLDQDSDFWNWNMFFDVAAGNKPIAISGTGIGKVISNTITAEIFASKIEADRLSVIADDYSIKNIIVGTISGSGMGSVGLQVLYTRDDSTTSALIGGSSELSITRDINMDASNRKDGHQILVVGSGAQYFAVNGNGVVNNITDKTIAKIDNGTTAKEIKAGTVSISADEDINSAHIIVASAGAQNLAFDVSPTLNSYDSTVEAAIKNAKIKDASIDMDADSNIGTLDVSVGVAGVAKGIAGIGVAIKNTYTDTIKAYIDSAIINTTRNIFIDANSVIDTTNWLVGVGVAGQGADLLVNVLLNDVNSELEAGIKNSTIEKSGAITINTNKNKKDEITNYSIAAGGAYQGGSAIVNVIKNVYENTVKSYVENTSSTAIDALSVNAYSEKRTNNANAGVGFVGQGVGLQADASVNDIASTVRAYVDAKSKTLNITNALSLETIDQTIAKNTMAMINAGIYGGALGVNVDLFYSDNLVKSEILSSSSGQINAGSSLLKSEVLNAHNNTYFDLQFGGIVVPIDVQIIELGKRTETYSEVEKQFVDGVNSMIPASLYTPTTDTDKIETGAISRVKGNLKTANNTQIQAQTQLKGIDNDGNLTDKYETENKHITAAGAQLNVGIRKIGIASNTVAEISGGKVESTDGDVSLDAESKADVKIDSTAVEVGAIQVSGRSASYKNSAETTAQIKDATVKAKNIEVNAKTTDKSYIDATMVEVALGGIVTVDLAEAIDTNKTAALITGNTNIDATGKLTLHANTSTDLTSWKTSVPVQIVDLVGVSRNRAESSSIARAIIENVNGTINTNGLDIITDYDKMYTYSKSNIVAVKPIDIASYDDSGAFMNASFKSGIDSEAKLILNNTGTTNIITARDNQTDGSGMKALGNIHNVHVSFVNFYTGAFSKAENTATSSTVLKAKDHKSNNLNIEQYLNSSAIAEAGNTKVTLVGFCNAVSADAKDTSTLSFDIGGSNTVVGEAIINATHNSKIKSDLSHFNLGVVVSGGRIRIDSYLVSNTNGNIGGKFNVGNAVINVNTIRDSTMSKGSGSGGFINVSDTEVSNTLTGDSILNIKNVTSDAENINNWSIANKSENTFDISTRDGSGGFLNVSLSNLFTNFTTSTNTNIENSNINSSEKVKFEVDNQAIFKDSAWSNGGGVISIINNYTLNQYTAGAKLLIKDTKINSGDLELKASSDMRTSTDDYVAHTGAGGGFVAVSYFTLINNLTQSAEIDIQNSDLSATRSAIIQALTSSRYKQKMDADFRGFIAVPRFSNTLKVNNTEKLALDNNSKITAGEKLDISFNSNNDLAVRTFADARNLEGVPAAWAYLYLTINNVLENNGSLAAGNLVDIKFMNKSTNNLTQYAHSENDALIASTTEDGILSRTINNTLNVNSGADITSGKDVNISYSIGTMKPSSEVSWVTDSLWFIEDTGTASKDTPSNNYTLKNDGKIVAGSGNNRYMKINRDGTIDPDTLSGFFADDYIVFDGQVIDGQTIKDKNLAAINSNIQRIEEAITELDDTIADMSSTIEYFAAQKEPLQAKLDELNALIAEGYILIESEYDANGNSDFNTLLENDISALLISEEDENKITQAQYNQMMSDYSDKLAEISVYNYGHSEKLETPNIVEFLGENDFSLSEAQIETIRINYGFTDEAIVGDADAQISQEKYNEISNAYQAKLTEIDEYNFGHAEKQTIPTLMEFLNTQDYGFTEAQKNTIETGYNTVDGNTKLTAVGKFTTYENASGKYLAVSNLATEGETQTFKEMTQLNTEMENLTNQINAYSSRKTASENNKTALTAQITVLEAERETVLNTDADKYAKTEGVHSIVFNDIVAQNSHINIDGAYNNNISGNGEFNIASSGLKIDNYSTRSLIFNRIEVDNINDNGLIIGGKNHSEFANKPQAVSGDDAYYYLHPDVLHPRTFDNLPTDGVHYTIGSGGISGVTVNNYYDVNHPFAEDLEGVVQPTSKSNIFFNDSVETSSLDVWNESGNITFTTNTIVAPKLNLYTTNGQIGVIMHNDENNTKFSLSADSNIFAADGLAINADSVDLKGTIKTGYSDRNITITEDMLNNLIEDPTSGEVNMIDLGGTPSPYFNAENNIKAIYKDGQIYLYKLPDMVQNNGVQISTVNGDNASGSISGNITVADGYQKITINNQTDKPLNVAEVNNVYIEGNVKTDGIDTTQATIVKNSENYAETSISSKGKLYLNGVINNNLRKGQDSYMVQNTNGKLNITAENGLEIAAQTIEENAVDAIFAGGLVDITVNGGKTDIAGNITDKGNVNIYNYGDGNMVINGNITDTAGDISIQNKGAGKLTANGAFFTRKGDISILGTGTGNSELNNAITTNAGEIFIVSKGLNVTEDASITNKKGNIWITNNDNILNLQGAITAQEGDISLQNNGSKATVAGSIADEKGDLNIINNNGNMTVAAEIYHNYLHQDTAGMISIINTEDAGILDIQTAVQTWGAGKTEDDETTAVLIDNRSNTDGLTLKQTVAARLGDIIIKNTKENLTVSGMISNSEQGNISLLNAGKDLQTTANILNRKGDVTIANNGNGKTLIGGSIENQDGNISISSNGIILEVAGTIDNSGGNTLLNNTAGQTRVVGNITNQGGNIEIDNTGSFTEISGVIENESGSVNIANADGHLNIKETAQISNTTDDAKQGITITNSGDNLSIAGNVENKNKGNIEITNNGNGKLDISGTVAHSGKGNVEISNSGADELNSTGDISVNNGNLSIVNDSEKGAKIAGSVTNANGNTNITNSGGAIILASVVDNNGGDLTVSNTGEGGADISGTLTNAGGDITIENQNGLTLAATLKNTGGDTFILNEGGADISGTVTNTDGNISVNNQGKLKVAAELNNRGGNTVIVNDGDAKISGSITDRGGNTKIANQNGEMEISADIDNSGGNVIIDNTGNDLTLTSAAVINNAAGNVTVNNSGSGKLTSAATINNLKSGNLSISNVGAEGTEISGTLTNVGGNTVISNENGALALASDLSNSGGDLTVSNNGNGATISGKLENKGGNLTISNQDGDLTLTDEVTVNNAAGNIAISNNGNGKLNSAASINNTESGDLTITNTGTDGAEISGSIANEGGNIAVNNKNGLELAAELSNRGGTTKIISDDDADISGTITNVGGDMVITNENGTFALASVVNNTGGDLTISNSGGDATVSGKLKNKGGNVTLSNQGGNLTLTAEASVGNAAGDIAISNNGNGKLVSAASISNTKSGDLTVSNTGEGSADISGTLTNAGGDITIENQNGLTLAATLKNTGGDTFILNEGGADISGTVTNTDGNISVNNQGKLKVAAELNNRGGNTVIVNDGDAKISGSITDRGGNTKIANQNGEMEISADIDNSGGNVIIDNIGNDLTLTSAAVINNAAGNVTVNNSGSGKLTSAATINNLKSGNLSISNVGAEGTEISGTLTNVGGNITIENQAADLVFGEDLALQNSTRGNIEIKNTADASALVINGAINNSGTGNIVVTNVGNDKLEVAQNGKISVDNGNLNLSNTNDGALMIAGLLDTNNGNMVVSNASKDGVKVAVSGKIRNRTKDIEINNSGAAGITVEGNILTEKQNIIINNRDSDLIIGEYESDNDNYLNAETGNIVINQTNGNVLNGITDTEGKKHQNADLGNPEHSYKTLLAAKGDLTLNVVDGDIGYTDNENPGFAVDAPTRDWTDSLNVNIGGNITATAANDNNSDARLINLRAKDSDLNLNDIRADGNVILTAADWKTADVRPTPVDAAYYKGYSVNNTAKGSDTMLFGQNISIISSDNIGTANKKLVYTQDTATNPQSAISMEAENNLYVSGQSNSDEDIKINQMISKRGSINIDLNQNAVINKITAAKQLDITQKAQNLTILELGAGAEDETPFEDILYPHDDLIYENNPENTDDTVAPEKVVLRVLDAVDSPSRGASNLKVYSLSAKGNNARSLSDYQSSDQSADITLMADNIYINSDKAPSSSIRTKANPDGYEQTQTSYTPSSFGFADNTTHRARGINSYGKGDALSLDILGVDRKTVENAIDNPQRNEYYQQTPVQNTLSKFRNEDSNYVVQAQNAVISVNDYATDERGVEFDTLYADDAYINTMDTKLHIEDANINDYAEIRNGNREADKNRHTVIIDNDYRRILPANIQLYTADTGTFSLTMSEKIKLPTTAPAIHYEWDKLMGDFSDENSFVRLGLKETELRQKAKDYYRIGNIYIMPQYSDLAYEVENDKGLLSNVKILEISRTGALIVNDAHWRLGEERELELRFDDVNVKLQCMVTAIKNNLATIKFTNMPEAIANKLAYRYMKVAAK